MNVAVFFTGALRTVKKTVAYLKMNVCLSENVHIFAALQNDTAEENTVWEEFFRKELGPNLQSISWFSRSDPVFSENQSRLLNNLTIPDNWIQYLRTSGSMVEYFQLYLAYQAMCKKEMADKFQYDQLIKYRTDTIFCKPVDFQWLTWTEKEIASRLDLLQTQLNRAGISTDYKRLHDYFMATLLDDTDFGTIQTVRAESTLYPTQQLPQTSGQYKEFLKSGNYIITFRANLMYIVPRRCFYLVPCLGTMYGLFKMPTSDPWWFNAEGQFRAACYQSGLNIYDYETEFESKSIYEFDRARYFDEDYNILHSHMVYCLVRN
jgi:hypothetical protein